VQIEAKPFSIGFRIEHPQSLIDRARFGKFAGHPARRRRLQAGAPLRQRPLGLQLLHVSGRHRGRRHLGTGARRHQRHEPVFAQRTQRQRRPGGRHHPEDFPGHPLAGIEFQRRWEEAAFKAGGENYAAPAQKVGDFLAGRASTELGAVVPSYTPGVHLTDLSACLPELRHHGLREALPAFGKQIHGFDMADALLTGVETRTSSPIRVTRDKRASRA
jgi:uncharacterized FAD-dependent dehydrogenase